MLQLAITVTKRRKGTGRQGPGRTLMQERVCWLAVTVSILTRCCLNVLLPKVDGCTADAE